MHPADFSVSYALPAVALAVALAIKTPGIVRAWGRESDMRAVGGLLVMAIGVFVSAVPTNIARVNDLFGVANIAAPIVYSLLVSFCGLCLVLIIVWRDDPSASRTRRIRWVVTVYAAVVIGLWATFVPADVGVERLRDLDTYYADTPWMREHILLYLAAHSVATAVAARLLWTWIPRVGGWLRSGLVFMQAGYVIGILYEAMKLTAYGSRRFAGHDLDWLSTQAAPPMAALNGVLVAAGFIIPHAGPYIQERLRMRRTYRDLGPLWRLMRTVDPSAAGVRLGPLASMALRLTRREADINDGLLKLARHLDTDLRARAHRQALAAGHGSAHAAAIAWAATIIDALGSHHRRRPGPPADEPPPHRGFEHRDLAAISRVLRERTGVGGAGRHAAVEQGSRS
ncbi:MAB_1171c family putative transporter [Streptomyces sp. NPDC006798]|uniref:MAB_1171c family putative transporter n=1 Tax=Streptomyces sp. NPDC006798 TaxID=3155462 RepID=UPI00340837DC